MENYKSNTEGYKHVYISNGSTMQCDHMKWHFKERAEGFYPRRNGVGSQFSFSFFIKEIKKEKGD